MTAGTGDCAASSGQSVDCTVQVPAGESVTITVDYVVVPFLDAGAGDLGGDDFRFVFVNGSVLEGSTAIGEVFLDGVDVSDDVDIVTGLSRNDLVSIHPDPTRPSNSICRAPTFTGGRGQSGGPVEGVDTNWQIAYFSIVRYNNNNGFVKACGDVTTPFEDRLDDSTVWQGSDDPPDAALGAADAGWNGGTLATGESVLRLDFKNKAAKTGYTVQVTVTDGTVLDISQ